MNICDSKDIEFTTTRKKKLSDTAMGEYEYVYFGIVRISMLITHNEKVLLNQILSDIFFNCFQKGWSFEEANYDVRNHRVILIFGIDKDDVDDFEIWLHNDLLEYMARFGGDCK